MSDPVTSSQTMPLGAREGKVLYFPMPLTGMSPPTINSITYLGMTIVTVFLRYVVYQNLSVFVTYPSFGGFVCLFVCLFSRRKSDFIWPA